MPDLAASRPTPGGPIESAWGGQIHDMLEGIQVGSNPVTLTSAATGEVVVTFPRPFNGTPVVIGCVASATNTYYAIIHSPTATTVTLRVVHKDGTNSSATVWVMWVAIGTPA